MLAIAAVHGHMRELTKTGRPTVHKAWTVEMHHEPAHIPRKIKLFGREFEMPRSRALRVSIGALLVIGGVLGFLPILGFWMIPLGLLVLSYEFAAVRRLRRRLIVWWERRQRSKRRA